MGARAGRRRFGTYRKLPSGRYQASYVVDGQRIIADRTFLSTKDASAWLAQKETEVYTGTAHNPKGGKVPFGEFADRYLVTRPKPLAPRTIESYRRMLRLRILPRFGRIPLTGITKAMVHDWYGQMVNGSDIGVSTARITYNLLHGIMAAAVEEERIPVNPCQIRRTGMGEGERPEPIPLEPEEVARIMDAIDDRYRAAVAVQVYSALRHGELIGLRRQDIDLKAGTIRVETQLQRSGGKWLRKAPKSRAGRRTIELTPEVRTELARHLDLYVGPERDATVFTTAQSGGSLPIHKENWNRIIRAAAETFGYPHRLYSHVFRHTGLTYYAQMPGVSLKELMVFAGHSSPTVALRYQHLMQFRAKAHAKAMSERVAFATRATVTPIDSRRKTSRTQRKAS